MLVPSLSHSLHFPSFLLLLPHLSIPASSLLPLPSSLSLYLLFKKYNSSSITSFLLILIISVEYVGKYVPGEWGVERERVVVWICECHYSLRQENISSYYL